MAETSKKNLVKKLSVRSKHRYGYSFQVWLNFLQDSMSSHECFVRCARSAAGSIEVVVLRLEWRWPAQGLESSYIIIKRLKLFMNALCLCAVRDEGLGQMFTDQVMLHRKALVSSLVVFV